MPVDNQNPTLETYDSIAEKWTATRRLGKDDFWINKYQKFRSFLPSGKILDIGCGSGADSFRFLEDGYEYLGVDGSTSMVSLARKNNLKAKFEVKDFNEIDSLGRSFNGFWAVASLLHIPKSNIAGNLKIIKKVIMPGGVGFISLKEGQGEKNEVWEESDFSRLFAYYQQEEFSEILKSAGFSILEAGKQVSKRDDSTTWLTYFVKT